MTLVCAKSQSRMCWAAIVGAAAGALLFQFFGNASRGYVDTPSLYWWWISQWIDPNAETEHGWLILGLGAWLFWRNLRGAEGAESWALRAGSKRGGGFTSVRNGSEADDTDAPKDARGLARPWRVVPPFGNGCVPLVAVGVALVLHAVGFVAQQSRISIVALLLFAWAMLALADRRWARAAAFPLGFMVFAIPLNVLDTLGFWLRLGVIDASAAIADLAGIDIVRSGTQLFARDGGFQYDVAAACSGVRSLMALSALSLLIGYLNFRSTWRRALMLSLCFPLTYLGNVARVVFIIFAAEQGGPRWGALVHDLMGYGIFVIVLGGVLGAATIVRRVWPEKSDAVQSSGADADDTEVVPPRTLEMLGSKGWISAGVVLVLVGLEMVFLAQISSSRERGAAGVRLSANGADPIELPAFLGTEWIGRRTDVSEVERAILPADTGFSRRTYVSVQDRSHAVFLSIVLSGRDRTSIHRPEICLVGQGWTITSTTGHEFAWSDRAGSRLPVTMLRTSLIDPESQRKVQALMAYCFVSADAVVASHWQRFVRDAWNRVRHGRVDRWAYVLVQADAQDGEAAAFERMQTVLDETLPVFLLAGAENPH